MESGGYVPEEPARSADATPHIRPCSTAAWERTFTNAIVICELFGQPDGNLERRKVETKWNGTRAELLREKRQHRFSEGRLQRMVAFVLGRTYARVCFGQVVPPNTVFAPRPIG